MHQVADLVFDAFFLVLVSAAVVTAWSWPFATGLFPLAIGIPVLIISLSQTAKDIIATKRGRNLRNRSKQRIRDIEVDRSVPTNLVLERAGKFYLCAIGFLVLILLIGFKLAVPLFIVVCVRLIAKATWLLTIVLMALMAVLVLGVFDNLLNIPWPESLLDRIFEITS